MDKLVRRVKGLKRTFFVYTEEEANDEGIKYKHWKDVESGDYGKTDDNYVAVCIEGRNTPINSIDVGHLSSYRVVLDGLVVIQRCYMRIISYIICIVR